MYAAQLNQVIQILEGKITRLDQRSYQVVSDCKKLLNSAIKELVEILHFKEETKEEKL